MPFSKLDEANLQKKICKKKSHKGSLDIKSTLAGFVLQKILQLLFYIFLFLLLFLFFLLFFLFLLALHPSSIAPKITPARFFLALKEVQ